VPGPSVIGVKFGQDGGYRDENQLTNADPRDTANPMNPHKRYEVQFEAGKVYVIDHMSNEFDAYLRVLDDKGKELASDDDGGDGLNSRIRFTAPQTGRYVIHASQLLPRGGRYTFTIRTE
jgi:hypothetical protein